MVCALAGSVFRSPLSEFGKTFVAELEMINPIVAFCALKP
jgi:hypothetical protein